MKASNILVRCLEQSGTNTDALAWFETQRGLISKSQTDLNPLYIALAMARRKLGSETLGFELDGQPVVHWNRADVARLVLLLDAVQAAPANRKTIVASAYSQGDEYEREAILKGLALLDPNGQMLSLAVDACRTNVLTMLAAIGMENPFPARFFGEHEFNQLVLKSLFLDFCIDRIVGLRERLNVEMSRMCYDYLRERLAANRLPPASLWLSLQFSHVPQAEAQFQQFLNHHDEQQRVYLAKALSWQTAFPAALRAAAEQQLAVESSAAVREQLHLALDPQDN